MKFEVTPMKHKLPCFAEGVLLSLLGAYSSVGCLVTAFGLKLAAPERVAAVWALWAVLCAGLLLRRWAGLLLLIPAGGAALWAWYEGSFVPQLLGALGTIAQVYDGGYGWGVPKILEVKAGSADLPMAALGLIVILAVCRTVCSRKGNGLTALLLLLPLASCLVVTDTVPRPDCLFALLLCLVLLLLTDGVRRESGNQASRLAAAAVIPVALALAALLYFFPRESYVNQTEALRERLISYAAQLPAKLSASGIDLPTSLSTEEQVELSSLPNQLRLGIPVAEVTAQQTGPVYLRIQDYDTYTGLSWTSSPTRQETLTGTGVSRGTVTVRTLNTQDSLMIPSFPEGQTILVGGTLENTGKMRQYSVECWSATRGAAPAEQWLQLPAETQRRAAAVLQTIPVDGSSTVDWVRSIADFVRGRAPYDRHASAMPPGETDFALWFLEKAERGYCVHFATAAAVLLRSAGIPARYVVGYKAEASGGQTVKVTSDDAHAWVEYYDGSLDAWMVLEATPADLTMQPETQMPTTEAATQPTTLPAAAQTAPTLPQPTAPEPEEQGKPLLPLWIPAVIVALGLLAALLEGQRVVRIHLVMRRQRRGSRNEQACQCWREVKRLCKVLRRTPPESLNQLAEKAQFSQHKLTAEELEQFAAFQAAARRRLRQAPWWKRSIYRYWFAVI